MRLNSITFFKTPLDDKYRNVFDFNRNFDSENSFKSNYFDSLYDNYNSFDITFDSGEERAINRKDDIIFITIPATYEKLHEYNYVCFNEKYYYFILNIEELNSIPNNECCKIVLSKDIWIDNYYAYKHGNYNKNQNVLCKHLKRYTFDEENESYKIDDNFPLTYETEPNSTSKILSKVRNGYTFNSDCRVLWLRICIENGLNVVDVQDTLIEITPFAFGYSFSTLNYVFVPFMLFKNNTLEYKFVKTYGAFTSEINPSIRVNVGDYTLNPYIPNSAYEYILKIDLTFNAPFNAWATFSNGDVAVDGYSMPIAIKANNPLNYTLIWNENVPIYKAYKYDVHYDTNNDYIIDKPVIDFNKYTEYTNLIGDKEPAFYMYPWKYQSLKFYNDEIDIVSPTYLYDWILKYEPKGEGFAYSLYINNKESYERDNGGNKVATINPNGSIPTYKDSYTSYVRNNGESLNTDYNIKSTRAIMNGVMNLMPSKISDIDLEKYGIQAAKTIANTTLDLVENKKRYNAKITDLKNAQDSYSLPSTFASLDLFYQDRALVYNINGDNTIVKDKLRLKLIEYGSNVDAPYDITVNERVFYDYIQTENCSIPSIINLDEREKFEKILDGGVRKWHIDEINNMSEDERDINGIYNKIKNFNTLVCNMEKEEE